jgi:hypothetical protein
MALTNDLLRNQEPSPAPAETRFDWPVCYAAEEFLLAAIDRFLVRNRFGRMLSDRMRADTGTLLIDWTDHIVLSEKFAGGVSAAGFTIDAEAIASAGLTAWQHGAALLPRVLSTHTDADYPVALAVRVESLMDFMMAHGISAEPAGAPLSPFRRVTISRENGTELTALERRGYRGFVECPVAGNYAETVLRASERWHTRPRQSDDSVSGYRAAHELLDQIIGMVGRDAACELVFEGERAFWQRRNRAAQIQKQRQDRLGLGWANHDHHTFRSSREHFLDLMVALEKLGFERRERYYAGSQAGWGAQILEQPITGIVAFCDLDLFPEETEIDFSRKRLLPATRLGTVGLWVGLHGESFLGAGMHHLEARFDFAEVRQQLQSAQITGMAPFSDFDFLKQAFTEGERWQVKPVRAEKLHAAGLITQEQYERFIAEGALGSHLETLQRRGGFKGFNQKSVSAIIAATDPRRLTAPDGANSQ